MTFEEFEEMINPLNLSVRSHNVLLRSFNAGDNEEYLRYKPDGAWKDAVRALNAVSGLEELGTVVIKHWKQFANMGQLSRDEILDKITIATNTAKSSAGEWHDISEGLPPVGVPLMARAEDGAMVYPVLYVKHPYINGWRFIYFNLEEYEAIPMGSFYKEWKEIV